MPPKRPASNRRLTSMEKHKSAPELDQSKRKAESSRSTKKSKSEVTAETEEETDASSGIVPTDTELAANDAGSQGQPRTSGSKVSKGTNLSDKGRENDGTDSTPKNMKCAICLGTQKYTEYNFLPCGHGFHWLCIEISMALKKQCPLCKTKVLDIFDPVSTMEEIDSDDEDEDDGDYVNGASIRDADAFFSLIQIYKQS